MADGQCSNATMPVPGVTAGIEHPSLDPGSNAGLQDPLVTAALEHPSFDLNHDSRAEAPALVNLRLPYSYLPTFPDDASSIPEPPAIIENVPHVISAGHDVSGKQLPGHGQALVDGTSHIPPIAEQLDSPRLLPCVGETDDIAHAHMNSAWKNGINSSMAAASMIADMDNLSKVFMNPIPDPRIRGRRYASGINPLSRMLWGQGSLVGLWNAGSMLTSGDYSNGSRYLLQTGTNFANYVSANGRAYRNIAKKGIDLSNASWAERVLRRWFTMTRWHELIGWLGKGRTADVAHIFPGIAPIIGTGFSALSLSERGNRPDSWANDVGAAGDVISLTSLAALSMGQHGEKFMKANPRLAPFQKLMLKGGKGARNGAALAVAADLYNVGSLLRSASHEADPDGHYHGMLGLMRAMHLSRQSVTDDWTFFDHLSPFVVGEPTRENQPARENLPANATEIARK